MSKHKITIVDDHKIFRKGLKMVLESSDYTLSATEYSSGTAFLNSLSENDSKIIFMDISMPELSGFDTTQKALEIMPDLKIVGMSASDDIHSINKLLEAGAVGFLSKDADFDEIHAAVKNIAEGNNYFSNNVLVKLTKNIGKPNQNHAQAMHTANQMSTREYQVLQLICKGASNVEIAEKLSIAERTVEKHKSNLYLKTDTENVLNLVLYAFKNGIVESP